jgi:hypothetical protein
VLLWLWALALIEKWNNKPKIAQNTFLICILFHCKIGGRKK